MNEPKERLIPWHVISSSYPDEEDPWDILDNKNLDNSIEDDDDDFTWDEDDDLE